MAVGSGVLLSRYQDAQLVSAGGMAELYSAVDPVLRRRVAIKILNEGLATDRESARRFSRQALAAARLSGEWHVATIYDIGETAGRPFIVTEYLPGGSIEDVLREQGAPRPAKALRWLAEAAAALDRAHDEGVVHGHVHAGNLLLDESGHVHVTDFGLADAVAGRAADPEEDQFALALVARELLNGSRPLESPWPTTAAARRAPATAGAVLDRALAADPADRFESCGRFVDELKAAFADEAPVTKVLPGPASAPRPGVWRARILPLAGLVLLVAGGVAAAMVATRRGDHQPAVSPITLTRPGTTVRETVTAEAPVVTVRETVTLRTPAPGGTTVVQTVTSRAPTGTTVATVATGPTGTPTTGQSSASLALAGYRMLQSGDAQGALPFLRSAAARLNGSRTLAEAYNDYNLALAIEKTEGCTPQVRGLLDESEAIQGRRTEIDRLRGTCGHG